MFGTNPIANRRTINEGFLVHSIWRTIQGEGPFTGQPALFVRFAGCNLQCKFCDTEFDTGAKHYSLVDLSARIINEIDESGLSLIVLTGGEPMLQPLVPLINELASILYETAIQIETAGTVIPKDWETLASDLSIHVVCSPKTPKIHPLIADDEKVHFKYIVDAAAKHNFGDMLPSNVYVPDDVFNRHIWVQACDVPDDPERTKANLGRAVCIAMQRNYRLSLQTHKIIGVD